MKITVYQAKGSAGKTPIATNIALDREYGIGTNEAFHIFDQFSNLPDDRIFAIDLAEEFPPFPDDIDVVFDLAGTISTESHSITSAIKQSNLVLVPIFNEVKSLHSGVGTLREIQKIKDFKGECIVIATKLRKHKRDTFTKGDWSESLDFQNIAATVHGAGFDYPILPLKFSTVFDAIFEREMSIDQLCAADPLARYSFREVANQFDDVYAHIDRISHAK